MATPVQKNAHQLTRWGRIKASVRRAFAPKRQRLPDFRTTGQDGAKRSTSYRGGWRPNDEFNRIDYGSTREFFEELQRTRVDGKVRGAIEFIMGHQVGPVYAGAYFKPRGDSPEAIRNANYANEAFGLGGGEATQAGLLDFKGRGRMVGDFANRFRTISNWQLDGFSLHEETYHVAPDADGNPRVWLKDLRSRWGGHVDCWHTNDDGDICAVTLRRSRHESGTGTYRLPINNDPEHEGGIKGALHIAFDIDGSADPEGRMGSLLRACGGARRLKEHVFNQLGIGVTRWAMPVPKIKVLTQLAEQLGVDVDTLAAARDAAVSAAAEYGSDAAAWLQDSDLVEIGEFGGTFNPSGCVEVNNYLDHQMLTALFMHWLAMGVAQSHGSGAAAITHGNAVLQVSRALAQRTCREIERQTLRRLLEMNFAEVGPIPELVLPGIDPNPLAGVDIVGSINVGALTPTDDLERVIRRQIPGVDLDFPQRPWQDRLSRASATPPGANEGRPEGSVKPVPTEVRAALDAALAATVGAAA